MAEPRLSVFMKMNNPSPEQDQSMSPSLISSAEVKKALDRAADRLSFILCAWSIYETRREMLKSESLRDELAGWMEGAACVLTDVFLDLKGLDDRLYPEGGESDAYWPGRDISCELSTLMSILDLLYHGGFDGGHFFKKTPERAIFGAFEVIRDLVKRLDKTAAEVMARDVIDPARATPTHGEASDTPETAITH